MLLYSLTRGYAELKELASMARPRKSVYGPSNSLEACLPGPQLSVTGQLSPIHNVPVPFNLRVVFLDVVTLNMWSDRGHRMKYSLILGPD